MMQDSDWGYPSRFYLGIKPLLLPTAALYTIQGLGNLWFVVAVLKMGFPGAGIMLIGSGLVGPSPGAGAKGFPDKLQVTSGKSDVLS